MHHNTSVTQEDIDSMKKLLSASDMFSNTPPPPAPPTEPSLRISTESYSKQPSVIAESSVQPNISNSTVGWVVKTIINENTNKVRYYTISHGALGVDIVKKLQLKEAAFKAMELLNAGVTVDDEQFMNVLFQDKMFVETFKRSRKAVGSKKESLLAECRAIKSKLKD